ncbi:MAG TPA: Ig-like domain-containing protein [Planctomycetota bacterium]|nr:Ig-like domain-containing protein [Planctomycetota bacterium]
MVALLASCHGGGSDQPPALRVASITPSPGSVVTPEVAVRVVFDRDPDPATLTSDALYVQDGSGVIAGSHSYDAETRTWTWTPDDELPRGAQVTAVIAESVKGVDRATLVGARSSTFVVRGGTAAAPVVLRSNIIANRGPGVGMFGRGSARIAAGSEAWELAAGGAGPAEVLPVVEVSALHVDAHGGAAALGTALGPIGSNLIGFTSRMPEGGWSGPSLIVHGPGATPQAVQLLGNDQGDVVLHAQYSAVPPGYTTHQLFWAAASSPQAWQWLPAMVLAPNETMVSSLDGVGRVATLRNTSDFVLAERHDPALGTMATYTVAQGHFLGVEVLVASADGTLRAIWHAPGTARQSFAAPGQGFEVPTDVPIAIPTGSNWRGAPTGAVVGWHGASLVRSEAGSTSWVQATAAAEPLAAAMSPRGELVFVYFQLPDRLMLQRWRAGEEIDAPMQVAAIASAPAAFRSADVAVDGAGRAVVVFLPDVPGDLVAVRVE